MNHPPGNSGGMNALDALSAYLKFPESHQVLTHWRALSAKTDDGIPERQDIDPISMIESLPYIFIMEVETDTGRMKYRLAGERISNRHDHGIIGKYLDEITPSDTIARVQAYFDICPNRPAAILLTGVLYSEQDKPGYGERLLLPLKDSKSGTKGLIGHTFQSSLFPDAFAAKEQGERILRIAPLAGGPLEERKAPLR